MSGDEAKDKLEEVIRRARLALLDIRYEKVMVETELRRLYELVIEIAEVLLAPTKQEDNDD